ncbi:MAG TPA: hypothetical protein VEF76_00530, partial [Patescibacteria group bacterium]|nr:hypothetical protein [Patescibacteria group bacterium]
MPHAPQKNAFNLASAQLNYSPEDVAAFIELVRHRSKEAVEGFIAQKGRAIVHVRDAEGMSPVMHASHTGHSATIELLIKHGADIDAP